MKSRSATEVRKMPQERPSESVQRRPVDNNLYKGARKTCVRHALGVREASRRRDVTIGFETRGSVRVPPLRSK